MARVDVGNPLDTEWGEIVGALVVLRSGAVASEAEDAKARDAFRLEHIASFKRPKRYVIVESLPKNNFGKVLKTVLREWVR